MRIDRRQFLATAALLPAASFAPKFRLSLAAYSMRKYLDLKKPTMKLEEFIAKTAEWGFDGVELTSYYFEYTDPSYIAKLKAAAEKAKLPITGTPIGNTFTHPPGDQRNLEIKRVETWIDIVSGLGSPAIRIFAGNTPKDATEADARKWAIECIETVLPTAEKRGVKLAIENHGGIVATADGLLAIVKAIKSDSFGINLDTGNFHSADAYGELERCAPYAITCQVKAEMSLAGKKEDADYPRIVAMMAAANYKGFLTLEYESAEEPLTAIPKQLELLRKANG
jgi:sugar phosphate isomerase/epimerase